jgi:hypothetical protein
MMGLAHVYDIVHGRLGFWCEGGHCFEYDNVSLVDLSGEGLPVEMSL